MGTDLASSTPTDQLANALSLEAEKQAQQFSRKANVSTASISSGQVNREFRFSGAATNAINQVLAREQRAKAENKAAITKAALEAGGLVAGKLIGNKLDPNVNIFGRDIKSSPSTTNRSQYSNSLYSMQPSTNNSAFGGFNNSNVGGFTSALSAIAPFSNR